MKQPNAQDLYVPCESVLRGKAHLLRILFFEFLTWMRWGAFLHHHYPISSNIFQSILDSTFHFLPSSLSLFFNIQFPKPFCALHQPLLPHFPPLLPFFTLFPPFSFLYNFYFSSRFIFPSPAVPARAHHYPPFPSFLVCVWYVWLFIYAILKKNLRPVKITQNISNNNNLCVS